MCVQNHRQRGLTLIQLAFVLGILFLLFLVLAVPALSTASVKAIDLKCMSRARAIAACTRTYASNWDGWAHPDPCHYVKEFGYKLNTEPGYFGESAPWYVPGAPNPTRSQQRANAETEFKCQQDSAPIFRAHGIPTSYQVGAFFCGRNVASGRVDYSRVLIVAEVGQRHPDLSKDGTPRGHYVYADLHAELGYSPP